MTTNDYYSRLELSKKARQEDIRKAYYRLANIYHPDKNLAGAARFLEIKEAYEALATPEKRKEYDEMLEGKRQPEKKRTFYPSPSAEDCMANDFERMYRDGF